MAVETGLLPGEVDAAVRRLNVGPDDVVYLTGSKVAGFGNPRSDYDLYLVTASVDDLAARAQLDLARFRGAGRGLLILPIGDRGRVDIELYATSVVDDLAERLSRTDAMLDDMSIANDLRSNDLDFIHRLRIAQPIVNPSGLATLQQRFDFGRFRRLVAERYLAFHESRTEDAIGALEAGQLETAYLAARDSLEHAFDALLAAKDETYVGGKWRFEKAKRAFRTDPKRVREFWTLVCAGPEDPTQIRPWVDRALLVAQKYAFEAADDDA